MSESQSAPSHDAQGACEMLLALLEAAYGSAKDASGALARALESSRRAELPTTVPELLAFVRADLLPVLSGDLGPRLTMALLDDFIAQHEVRSGVRTKRPSPSGRGRPLGVLLVDADRVSRPALARALLRASCQVTVVDSPEELVALAGVGEPLDVAIVDAQHPDRLVFLEGIVDRFPGVSLVVRSAGEAAMRALLLALGATRFEVRSRDCSSEELIDAVLEVASRGR